MRRTHARRDGIEAPRGYEPEKDKLDEGDEEGTEAQGQAAQEMTGHHCLGGKRGCGRINGWGSEREGRRRRESLAEVEVKGNAGACFYHFQLPTG